MSLLKGILDLWIIKIISDGPLSYSLDHSANGAVVKAGEMTHPFLQGTISGKEEGEKKKINK